MYLLLTVLSMGAMWAIADALLEDEIDELTATATDGDDQSDDSDDTDQTTPSSGLAEFFGTSGPDELNGSSMGDRIFGLAGNDTLAGNAGYDRIEGGSGQDVLMGGAGDDQLFGGQNSDALDGGDGDDFLRGGRLADALFGGDGDDTLKGDAGNDSLIGGAGADTLQGGSGDDALVGGELDRQFDATALRSLLDASTNVTGIEFPDGTNFAAFDDGIADVLNGGDGEDDFLLGATDTGIGGAGEDSFFVAQPQEITEDGTSRAPAQITDFNPDEDDLILIANSARDSHDIQILENEDNTRSVMLNGQISVILNAGSQGLTVDQITVLNDFNATTA
jgi:Ca2+-binding RTX toxin-like protein